MPPILCPPPHYRLSFMKDITRIDKPVPLTVHRIRKFTYVISFSFDTTTTLFITEHPQGGVRRTEWRIVIDRDYAIRSSSTIPRPQPLKCHRHRNVTVDCETKVTAAPQRFIPSIHTLATVYDGFRYRLTCTGYCDLTKCNHYLLYEGPH